jgi:endoglucanase
MASRLAQAGIADAQGFALNVSNFRAQAGLVTYGQQLAAAIGVAHIVVDTSRNGLGPAPDGQWCNPPGRALGARPGTPSDYRLDRNLWIKRPASPTEPGARPGENEGRGGGAPRA